MNVPAGMRRNTILDVLYWLSCHGLPLASFGSSPSATYSLAPVARSITSQARSSGVNAFAVTSRDISAPRYPSAAGSHTNRFVPPVRQ